MGPPGPMLLTTSATGLPVAFVAPKTLPVLTVREGIVAEVPKGSNAMALASTGSVPASSPAQPEASKPEANKPEAKQPVKTKVAKASSKKKTQQTQIAQNGWQQNQPFGGGWEQPKQRSGRNASGGRYAMSGQQPFFAPFGTIR